MNHVTNAGKRATISSMGREGSSRAPGATKRHLGLLALGLVMGAQASASTPWPPFLPPPASYPPGVVAGVERIWSDPTLRRTVHGEPAPIPGPIYMAFFDTPDVTAAAARHLKLAKYEVRAQGDDAYEADDRSGAHGVYQVLFREHRRRVLFSRGYHTGRIGTIRGSALTVVDFRDADGRTTPRLTAYVLIDNRVAATLARALQLIFGHLADRKLMEGFKVTADVAAWAIHHPDESCPWLADAPVPPARREPLLDILPGCRRAAASIGPPLP
jgi:hypothetical protein